MLTVFLQIFIAFLTTMLLRVAYPRMFQCKPIDKKKQNNNNKKHVNYCGPLGKLLKTMINDNLERRPT